MYRVSCLSIDQPGREPCVFRIFPEVAIIHAGDLEQTVEIDFTSATLLTPTTQAKLILKALSLPKGQSPKKEGDKKKKEKGNKKGSISRLNLSDGEEYWEGSKEKRFVNSEVDVLFVEAEGKEAERVRKNSFGENSVERYDSEEGEEEDYEEDIYKIEEEEEEEEEEGAGAGAGAGARSSKRIEFSPDVKPASPNGLTLSDEGQVEDGFLLDDGGTPNSAPVGTPDTSDSGGSRSRGLSWLKRKKNNSKKNSDSTGDEMSPVPNPNPKKKSSWGKLKRTVSLGLGRTKQQHESTASRNNNSYDNNDIYEADENGERGNDNNRARALSSVTSLTSQTSSLYDSDSTDSEAEEVLRQWKIEHRKVSTAEQFHLHNTQNQRVPLITIDRSTGNYSSGGWGIVIKHADAMDFDDLGDFLEHMVDEHDYFEPEKIESAEISDCYLHETEFLDHVNFVPDEIASHPIGQFHKIRKLTLSNTHISSLDTGFQNFHNLRYIDLSHNELAEFPILEIPRLQILKLGYNRIQEVTNVDHLAIEQLDISNNEIDDISALRELIAVQSSLRVLKLNDNKVCTVPNYREKVSELCPQLERLDMVDMVKSDGMYKQRGVSSYLYSPRNALRNKGRGRSNSHEPNYMKQGRSSQLKLEKVMDRGEHMSNFLHEIAQAKQEASKHKAFIEKRRGEVDVLLPMERDDDHFKHTFGETDKRWEQQSVEGGSGRKSEAHTPTPLYIPRTTESARRREEETRRALFRGGDSISKNNNTTVSLASLKKRQQEVGKAKEQKSNSPTSAVPYQYTPVNERTFDDDNRQKQEDRKQTLKLKQQQMMIVKARKRSEYNSAAFGDADDSDLDVDNPTQSMMKSKIRGDDDRNFLAQNNVEVNSLVMNYAAPTTAAKRAVVKKSTKISDKKGKLNSPFSKPLRGAAGGSATKPPLSEEKKKYLDKLSTPKRVAKRHAFEEVNENTHQNDQDKVVQEQTMEQREHLRSLAKPKKVYKLVDGEIIEVNNDDLSDMTQFELDEERNTVSLNDLLGRSGGGKEPRGEGEEDDGSEDLMAKNIFNSRVSTSASMSAKKVSSPPLPPPPIHPKGFDKKVKQLQKGREMEEFKRANPEIKKSMMLYNVQDDHDMFVKTYKTMMSPIGKEGSFIGTVENELVGKDLIDAALARLVEIEDLKAEAEKNGDDTFEIDEEQILLSEMLINNV